MATDAYTDFGLFVDVPDRDEIVRLIEQRWAVQSRFSSLRVPGFLISVSGNKSRAADAGPDDYLDWPTMVDVNADDETTDDEAERFLVDLMGLLASVGFRCVADADFEVRPRMDPQ